MWSCLQKVLAIERDVIANRVGLSVSMRTSDLMPFLIIFNKNGALHVMTCEERICYSLLRVKTFLTPSYWPCDWSTVIDVVFVSPVACVCWRRTMHNAALFSLEVSTRLPEVIMSLQERCPFLSRSC